MRLPQEPIVERIQKVQEIIITCVPHFCQIAGTEALKRGELAKSTD
jgi:aspartate/methionine/tyrosine aminotransferase